MDRLELLLVVVALAAAAPLGLAQATSVSQYCLGKPEQQFLRLIDDYRASKGLGKLVAGQRIGAAAQHHSVDMAKRDYFSHTTEGTTVGPKQRMINHGYPADKTSWGENIYAGYGDTDGVGLQEQSAREAFNRWKNSPDHNRNMLTETFKAIGIDRAYNADATYKYYWTTDFGGLVDSQAAKLC
jgi:uncharacterized protein YkwD